MSNHGSSDLSISADVSSYLRKHYEGIRDSQQQAVAALKAIFFYLQRKYPDLRVIDITYDGSGDSGQIETIRFNPLWRTKVHAEVMVVDETMPDELAFGRKHQGGHWDRERGEWVADSPDCNPSLLDLLDIFAWDLAYGQNPGFEINEGGFGTISISSESDSIDDVVIELIHSERIEITKDYEYSF